MAGATGLEPATYGFGDRCATNCATPLEGCWVTDQASNLQKPELTAAFTLADRKPVGARLEVMGKIPSSDGGN